MEPCAEDSDPNLFGHWNLDPNLFGHWNLDPNLFGHWNPDPNLYPDLINLKKCGSNCQLGLRLPGPCAEDPDSNSLEPSDPDP